MNTWYGGLCGLYGGMPKIKMTNSKLNRYKNNFVFQNSFVKNLLDALDNRYDIEGLPNTCNKRVILQSLLWTGSVYFFKKFDNLIALPGTPDGSGLNVYGDFGGAWVYGANGFSEHINVYLPGSDDSNFIRNTISGSASDSDVGVVVRENEYVYPFVNWVIYYSDMMSDTLRKIEVAEKNAATPYVITAEESIVNTVKEYFNKRDENNEFIISSGVFPADKINMLKFDIQSDAIRAMTEVYDWYANHYRELCGIKNMTNIDKKGENLLSDEINISDEYTQLQNVLPQLNSDIDIVNKIFGTSIRVVSKRSEDENIQSNRQDEFVSESGGSSTDRSDRQLVSEQTGG